MTDSLQKKQLSAPAKPRFIGIDIVKILACMLVVCVHFFLYSGFYSEPITKDFGQGAIFLRWAAYCCVPLFMITTGYLMKNKTLSKKYFMGIIRVLIIYIIASIICYCFDMQHWPAKYDVPFGGYSPWIFIRGLFMFTDAQYAWYVEYYICIFLIIPFINLAFNNLKNKNQKLAMVAITAIITVVSQSLFIGFNDATQIRLLPGYFTRCYPIAYYLIGAFIRDYPPKKTMLNKLYFFVMYIIGLAWVSTTTFQQSLLNEENEFRMFSRHYNDYGSWPVALCSTMLFLLFFDIQTKNKKLTAVMKFISEATFACYLVSYVFDTIFYAEFCQRTYFTVTERCAHAYEVIPKIFVCSMGVALVIQAFYNIGEWIVFKKFAPALQSANTAESSEGETKMQSSSEEEPEHRSVDIDAEIEKLKMLFEDGILTEEEYQQQVDRISKDK